MTKKTRNQRGITLVELIVAVTLAAVLLMLAVPSFTGTIDRNRFDTQIGTLQASLNLARSEAVKRNFRVAVCAAGAADDCDPAAAWDQGWLIFVDRDAPAGEVNGRDEIVRRYDGLPPGFTLRATGGLAGAGGVSFLGSGYADQAGSFVLCKNGDLQTARGVNLFITGRPQQSEDGDGDGVHEDGGGVDFGSC